MRLFSENRLHRCQLFSSNQLYNLRKSTVTGVGKGFLQRLVTMSPLTGHISRPDFISYNHKYTKKLSVNLCRKLFNTPVVAWTVKTSEEWSKCADKFDAYVCEGLPKKKNTN